MKNTTSAIAFPFHGYVSQTAVLKFKRKMNRFAFNLIAVNVTSHLSLTE